MAHPISSLQDRLDALGSDARGRIRRALSTGNEKLMELDGALARMAKDDWTVPGMRKHFDGLRARAESLREAAVKRVSDLPAEAVVRIATGGRTRVQHLAKSLADLAQRLEPQEPASPAPSAAKRSRPEKAEKAGAPDEAA